MFKTLEFCCNILIGAKLLEIAFWIGKTSDDNPMVEKRHRSLIPAEYHLKATSFLSADHQCSFMVQQANGHARIHNRKTLSQENDNDFCLDHHLSYYPQLNQYLCVEMQKSGPETEILKEKV